MAALVSLGISPIESHFLKAIAGETDPDALRRSRDIGPSDWDSGRLMLLERGWVTAGESADLTPEGQRARADLEGRTDAAASSPWQKIGQDNTRELASLLRPIAIAIHSAGALPMPNPIGMHLPDEA